MRWLTIPNFVTLFRFFLLIPLGFHLFHYNKTFSIMYILLFAVLDGLDGFLARWLKQETLFGRNFDLSTDIMGGIVIGYMMIFQGYMPLLYISLMAIPTLLYVFSIVLSTTLHKSSFVNSRWKRITGPVLFTIPLAFLIGTKGVIIWSYLALGYFYVAAIQYFNEIYQRLKKKKINSRHSA